MFTWPTSSLAFSESECSSVRYLEVAYLPSLVEVNVSVSVVVTKQYQRRNYINMT